MLTSPGRLAAPPRAPGAPGAPDGAAAASPESPRRGAGPGADGGAPLSAAARGSPSPAAPPVMVAARGSPSPAAPPSATAACGSPSPAAPPVAAAVHGSPSLGAPPPRPSAAQRGLHLLWGRWPHHPAVLRHTEPLDRQVCALVDAPGTRDVADSQATVCALRARVARGERPRTAELTTFTRVSCDNDLRLLLDRQYFHELLPTLHAARSSIHIAVLTIDHSPLGEAVAALLLRKKAAAPQVRIRLLVDNLGSRSLLPWSPTRRLLGRLRRGGVEVLINDVLRMGLEHRKLVVVDGVAGFFGGTCMGHEYYGSTAYWRTFRRLAGGDKDAADAVFRRKYDRACRPQGPLCELDDRPDMPEFHDFTMRARGTVVQHLQASFMQSWLLHGRPIDPELSDEALRARYFPPPRPAKRHLPLKMVHSVPGGRSEIGPTLLEMVALAQHRLDVTFAYVLIPQFVEVLVAAAQRGVAIRLLVPGVEHIDIPPAYWALRAQYPRLFEGGRIALFEYRQYTHVKLMVADSRLVLASTGNPEWDSWERGFDETAIIDSPKLAAIVERRVFAADLSAARATPITAASLAHLSLWGRLKMRACRFLFDLFFRVRSDTQSSPPLSLALHR